MPPRHVYWTIIAGGQPTAFRAAEREELLPTLKQLQSRHPDAVMMWFARGKLWPTKEAAEFTLRQEHRGGTGGERRGKDWRPGGEHKDPRDRFKVPRDVKRARFAERARRNETERPASPPGAPKPHRGEGGPREDRQQGARPSAPRGDRPFASRPAAPKGEWGKRPASPKPHRGEGEPQGDRPFRPREDRPQGDRPFRPKGDRPQGDRPFRPKGDRPQGARPFKPENRPAWGKKPASSPASPKPHRGEGGKPRSGGGGPHGDRPKPPTGGGGFKPRGPRPVPPKRRRRGGE